MTSRKTWRQIAPMVLFICSATTTVSAQQALAGDELKSLISGKSVRFSDGSGVATYKADGKYEFFNMNTGATRRGKWIINADRVCIDSDDGHKRCDQYIKEGGRTYLKNSSGAKITFQIQ